MRRVILILLGLALVGTSCGGDDVATTTEAPNLPNPATTAAPSVTAAGGSTTTSAPPINAVWDLSGIEITLEQPELWRAVAAPPEGADAAVYAPSDNNFVAERLLVKAVTLDPGASPVAQVEDATNDLQFRYDNVVVLQATPTVIGVDQFPAQQIRFTWETVREAGVGWRWVVAADTQLIYITFLADVSEPNLYLRDVQEVLSTAVIGG